MSSPTVRSVSTVEETRIPVVTCSTVIAAAPDACPAVAVTRALPFPVDVTSPALSTVAIAPSLDAHVMVAFVTTCPFWSSTRAAN